MGALSVFVEELELAKEHHVFVRRVIAPANFLAELTDTVYLDDRNLSNFRES